MKFIVTILLSVCTFSLFSQEYARCKIFTDSQGLKKLAELGVAVDHGTYKENTFFISDFSAHEIGIIQSNNFEFEILIADVQAHYINQNKGNTAPQTKNATCDGAVSSGGFTPQVPENFELGSMAGFYTYQEFLDEIDAMAAAYPTLISTKAPISSFTTHQGRPIYWLRISDNATQDENEPEVLYTALHHAREAVSLSQTIFYMWYLLENYATNPEVKFLVDNTEMYFVPMINPDGYIRNETTNPNGGGMWRKNRRNNGNNTFGVDLNRNYSYGWGTTGVSMNTNNDTYPGTGPFSEPETQAIKWFCENRNFQFAFNAHSYSDMILFPIGVTTQEFAEDHDYFQAISDHMVEHNGYIAQKSSSLYPASGDSDDWMYISDLTEKPEIFAMTPEIGGDADGFWPALNNITPICQEMVFPNLILAHLVHRYYKVSETDPSTIETISGNFSHSASRLGVENGSVTVEIEALQGIASVGNPVVYNLNQLETQTNTISYTLNPTIQFGDEVKYILKTIYPGWTRRDTISKTFGTLTLQTFDDATNTSNWVGNFALTGSTFYSPSQSFTDSPTGNYVNNASVSYRYKDTIDLSNATAAGVSFYAKWNIENNYDYTQLQVSTDFGATWIGQCGIYTNLGTDANGSVQPDSEPVYDGVQTNWVLEEINLSDYLGEKILVRFLLESDGAVRADGFYFDDIKISFNESQAGLNELSLGIKTFPNPANEQVIISMDAPVNAGTIAWFDQTGKQIGELKINEITNKVLLNTQNLANGMYTIRISIPGYAVSQTKLVVIH